VTFRTKLLPPSSGLLNVYVVDCEEIGRKEIVEKEFILLIGLNFSQFSNISSTCCSTLLNRIESLSRRIQCVLPKRPQNHWLRILKLPFR